MSDSLIPIADIEALERAELSKDNAFYRALRAELADRAMGPNSITPGIAVKRAILEHEFSNRLTVPVRAARILENVVESEKVSSHAISLCVHAAMYLESIGEIRAPTKSFIEWEVLSH